MPGRLSCRERKPDPAGLLGAGGELPTTGPRNVTALLASSATGTVMLDRTGHDVTLSLESVRFVDVTSGSWGTVLSLPIGFRPKFTLKRDIVGSSQARTITLAVNGTLSCHRDVAYEMRQVWTYSTADAWPSALPGT